MPLSHSFHLPLFFSSDVQSPAKSSAPEQSAEKKGSGNEEKEEEEEEEEEEESIPGATLFIKNLNFSTTEEALRQVRSTLRTGSDLWSL